MHRIGESYATLRRYAPEFLAVLKLRAAPTAKSVLDAIDVLRTMNTDNARKMPADGPTAFVKPRWAKLVLTGEGIDQRYYELCALSELKNALRSGDVWVQGSRQFKDFDEYLVPVEKFATLKLASELPLAVPPTATSTCMTGCYCWNSSSPQPIAWLRPTICLMPSSPSQDSRSHRLMQQCQTPRKR